MRKNQRVGIRRGAAHVTRMCEEIRGSPEKLHAGFFLTVEKAAGQPFENAVSLAEIRSFRREIAVMKTVVPGAELCEEFKCRVDPVLRRFPWTRRGPHTKRIRSCTAERVPCSYR